MAASGPPPAPSPAAPGPDPVGDTGPVPVGDPGDALARALSDLGARLAAAAADWRTSTAGAPGAPSGPAPAPTDVRPVAQGRGDVTFALDAACEAVLDAWLDERARLGPLSLLTEDAGWRHRGPGPDGRPRDLPGFDHGGPRVVVDPVDGTRHLLFDLRPAWCLVAAAGPGPGVPHLSDLGWGEARELPTSRDRVARRLRARHGAGCALDLLDAASGEVRSTAALRVDDDDRPDHGYFPFFAYHPDVRAAVDGLAADFFARLARDEAADVAHCYDDQYIASGGQLALLALSAYRMAADVRPHVMALRGRPTQCAKPYDLAAAVLCAREAGVRVTDLHGAELDIALDADTPVAWAAFVNEATHARLAPHLAAAVDAWRR